MKFMKISKARVISPREKQRPLPLVRAIFQIMILDMIFSLDSVITAVGMARHIYIMIAAIVAAVVVMMVFAGLVGDFIHKHPSIKVLALSFLLLIGVMLVAESLGKHIERGYIYFAMGFSLLVELINMRVDKVNAEDASGKGRAK